MDNLLNSLVEVGGGEIKPEKEMTDKDIDSINAYFYSDAEEFNEHAFNNIVEDDEVNLILHKLHLIDRLVETISYDSDIEELQPSGHYIIYDGLLEGEYYQVGLEKADKKTLMKKLVDFNMRLLTALKAKLTILTVKMVGYFATISKKFEDLEYDENYDTEDIAKNVNKIIGGYGKAINQKSAKVLLDNMSKRVANKVALLEVDNLVRDVTTGWAMFKKNDFNKVIENFNKYKRANEETLRNFKNNILEKKIANTYREDQKRNFGGIICIDPKKVRYYGVGYNKVIATNKEVYEIKAIEDDFVTANIRKNDILKAIRIASASSHKQNIKTIGTHISTCVKYSEKLLNNIKKSNKITESKNAVKLSNFLTTMMIEEFKSYVRNYKSTYDLCALYCGD